MAYVLRSARLIHLYFGALISPALLFFAFTGALQTFSLHETTRGSNYVPPRWAVVLGQIHKKQTAVVPVRNPPSAQAKAAKDQSAAAPREGKPAPAISPTRHPLPLKLFFLLVSVGLLTSTVTGVYMAFQYTRQPRIISALLLAGTVIPIALVFV